MRLSSTTEGVLWIQKFSQFFVWHIVPSAAIIRTPSNGSEQPWKHPPLSLSLSFLFHRPGRITPTAHTTSPEFMLIVSSGSLPGTDALMIRSPPHPTSTQSQGRQGQKDTNGGHGPTSAGNGYFIGWQKKLWSVQAGEGQRQKRGAAGLDPDRAR